MALIFANNGILSLIDILTIGGSEKRNDSSKIGQYSSGLSYAISILVRQGIEFKIISGMYKYTFSTTTMEDEISGKSKEVISVTQRNLSTDEEQVHITAFSVDFGFDWELYMAIREIYANCLDEKGHIFFPGGSISDGWDTKFIIEASPEIQDIIDNWNSYFLDREAIPLNSDGPLNNNEQVKVYFNTTPGQKYTIYKQGIQIYQDPERISLFIYNIKDADIDEMRLIRNLSSAEYDISSAVLRLFRGEDFHKQVFIELCLNEELYENDLLNTGTFSDAWVEAINSLYLELGDKFPKAKNNPFWRHMLSDRRFQLNTKRISNGGHWWNEYKVEVREPLQEERLEVTINDEPISFEDHIKNSITSVYDFKIDFPIKEAIIDSKDTKVIADTHEKCLYVSSYFVVEEDFHLFVKEYLRLSGEDIYKKFAEVVRFK